MYIFFRLTIGVLLIVLTSCSEYQHYVNYERQVKSCRIKCTETLKECNKSCFNNCVNCSALSNVEAAQKFKRYKHQQLVQGKIVALELQSFRDPLQCRKTTCSCKDDFRVCIQSCRGKIHKTLKVAAAC
jgi:hypothetical protein